MVSIREITENDRQIIRSLAELHIKAFPGFFLTQLGAPFLRTLYAGYIEDRDSGIMTAETDGELAGFIAYSRDYPRFYKGLMKRHLLKFALCSLGAAVKNPSFIRRLLGALHKSDDVKKEEPYVELASICVSPAAEGQGIGSMLISQLKSSVDFERYAYINLETDAENNDNVNRFYQKNGFALFRQYVTPEGRKMNEYRFAPQALAGETA